VWCGDSTSGRAIGVFTGRDLRTGEVKSEFPPDVETYWFHHRCHRGKATENYLLTSRVGIEFIDFRKKQWDTNHWVRGACLYGVMPANGLIYGPQHPCACYLETKLTGFNALAPLKPVEAAEDSPRLLRGPAYGQPAAPDSQHASDWPTYRHDVSRSGHTTASVTAKLTRSWQTTVGGRLSAVTVSGRKLFVAAIDEHTVHALDTVAGEELWQFTTGARVDSPPTIWKGRVLFGSADGHVYCLRASDGALVWRFRAAANGQRAMIFEQLESLWPVPGNVLVLDNIAYFVSGRSMFLDGGLRLYRLNPETGSVLSETVLDDKADGTSRPIEEYISWLNMPTGLPDILSYDQGLVFMRGQPFERSGKRLPLEKMPCGPNADAGAPPPTQNWAHAHLFSPTGFLDDTWWHRTYWMYGSRFVSGWQGYYRSGKAAPAGRILVFDDSRVYGFGREQKYFRWTTPIEHHLFAMPKPGASTVTDGPEPAPPKFAWSAKVPLFARGMVLAKDVLFIGGPRDTVDEAQLQRQTQTPEGRAVLAEYEEALAGRKGGVLWSVSTGSGEKLADCELNAPPVFDGMAATPGRLFLALTDGTVLCMTGTEQ